MNTCVMKPKCGDSRPRVKCSRLCTKRNGRAGTPVTTTAGCSRRWTNLPREARRNRQRCPFSSGGTEMRRRPHERDAATDPESSERDVRFGPDIVFRMRGSFRGPSGDSGSRARTTTALATLQFNREASPARTGRERGREDTARLTYLCRPSCVLVPPVVARSPDRATHPDRRSPQPRATLTRQWA